MKETIGITGLGYVGLPLAVGFAKAGYQVIGYDTNPVRIEELMSCSDRTLETTQKELKRVKHYIDYTADPVLLVSCDVIIVTVPTPVTYSKKPDLTLIESASITIGNNMKRGAIIVLESTVYPGVTEDVMGTTIARVSGMKAGKDFTLGYSPERINPGDKEHTLQKIVKVVSGSDDMTTKRLAKLYGSICDTVFIAKSIKVAEAAKVIENTQRDLNIALMNELSIICDKIGISVWDVLEASYTKWNFGRYKPGMIGGHCIPVDPYYLVHLAQELGYTPQVILAGRAINDSMPKLIAERTAKWLSKNKRCSGQIVVFGATFKENVPDMRTTPTEHLITELKGYGLNVAVYDPMVDPLSIAKSLGVPAIRNLSDIKGADCIIITVAHDAFIKLTAGDLRAMTTANPLLVDIRGTFKRKDMENAGFTYMTL